MFPESTKCNSNSCHVLELRNSTKAKRKIPKQFLKCASCVKHGKHLINLCNDLKKIESDSNG